MFYSRSTLLVFLFILSSFPAHAQLLKDRKVVVTNEVDVQVTNTELNPIVIEGSVSLEPETKVVTSSAVKKEFVSCMTNFNVDRKQILHTLRCRDKNGERFVDVPEGFEFAFTTLGIHSFGAIDNGSVEVGVSFGPQNIEEEFRAPKITDGGVYTLFTKLPGENVKSFPHPIMSMTTGQHLVVAVETGKLPSSFSAYTIVAKGFMVPEGTTGIAF